MEKRFHDPCPERGIGEEDMLATVCRGTCVANPPTPVHMHQEHGSHSLYSFGVAMLLCFGTCKDSHSPPTGALILLEWQNS